MDEKARNDCPGTIRHYSPAATLAPARHARRSAGERSGRTGAIIHRQTTEVVTTATKDSTQ